MDTLINSIFTVLGRNLGLDYEPGMNYLYFDINQCMFEGMLLGMTY